MRLEELDLDLKGIVMAEQVRNRPEDDWQRANDAGLIPPSLFSLYVRAQYLSFGAWPRFLSDHHHRLFSYFGLVLRSLKDCLIDAEAEMKALNAAYGKGYDFEKRQDGVEWDPDADEVVRRNTRFTLMSLLTSLDCLADLIALFLTDSISGLKVGRAQFSQIEKWVALEPPEVPLIAVPQQQRAFDLYQTIRPLVCGEGEQRDWLKYARVLRNKSAHVRSSLRTVVLKHTDGQSYTFIPKKWPYLWEEYMSRGNEEPPSGKQFMPQILSETLIHEDLLSFLGNLRKRVFIVLEDSLVAVNRMYHEFQDFPPNQGALDQLVNSFETTDFVAFEPLSKAEEPCAARDDC